MWLEYKPDVYYVCHPDFAKRHNIADLPNIVLSKHAPTEGLFGPFNRDEWKRWFKATESVYTHSYKGAQRMADKFYIEFNTEDGTKENPRIEAVYVEVGRELHVGTVENIDDKTFQVGPQDEALWQKLKRFVLANKDYAKAQLLKAYFPNVEFTADEREALGTILLEINVRETRLKQLGSDLRDVGEVLRYCARNMNMNSRKREALKRIMEYAKVAE